MLQLGLIIVKQVLTRAEVRARNRERRHHEWRQKQQDILVVFTGTVVREVVSGARQVAKNAGEFNIPTRGKPTRRADLPPGHPPIPGIEHVKPVIMTVTLHCSMEEAVDLLNYYMPNRMAVVPIPSERWNDR